MPHNKFVIFSTHRSRKRKQEEEEEEYDDGDIDKNGEDDYDLSDEEDFDSSDDEDEYINDEGDNRVKPAARKNYYWYDVTDLSPFQSVDGDKIFCIYSWNNERTSLSWDAQATLRQAERALESKQRKFTIKLERVFGRSLKLTQVPYRELTILHLFRYIDIQTFLT